MSSPPRPLPCIGPRCDLPLRALLVGSPLTNPLSSCRLSPCKPPAAEATSCRARLVPSPVGPAPRPSLEGSAGWIAPDRGLIAVSAQPSRVARRGHVMSNPPRPLSCLGPRCNLPLMPPPVGSPLTEA
ncbi:hypothetical protein N658DRAFT_346041 [Parathielavia hyrcaniae]|uniref:Uncharacterized protein n=1 Tax=Parathielavia hyrcaniae TaxID=113614 RepID=A0AAN6SX66_9PEZI|nr:hypothetical protein N658DRAFT_346041 [Parathielavia hyrcaniae]